MNCGIEMGIHVLNNNYFYSYQGSIFYKNVVMMQSIQSICNSSFFLLIILEKVISEEIVFIRYLNQHYWMDINTQIKILPSYQHFFLHLYAL